jgi:hypothetical protein
VRCTSLIEEHDGEEQQRRSAEAAVAAEALAATESMLAAERGTLEAIA